jgi:predicted permease
MHAIRQAIRALRTASGVSVVIVITLALGIGANTAIFTVVNSLLLRTLPVPAPDRLVTISSDYAISHGFKSGAGWNYAMWTRMQQAPALFDGVVAWSQPTFNLARSGQKDPVRTLLVSGDFFRTLGVRPQTGRLITGDDDVRGGGRDGAVVVISDRFWEHRFGRASSAIGSTLSIEGAPFTIVGVTPPEFLGIEVGQAFDIAIPLGTDSLVRGGRTLLDQPSAFVLLVIVRLKPGQSIAAATSALQSIQPHVLGVTPDRIASVKPAFLREPFIAVPAPTGTSDFTRLRTRYARPLLTLTALVGLVLLIACVNVASVLLARASARRYEFGVRLALGATRRQLVSQLMIESALLSTAGAAVGMLLARFGSQALVAQLSVLDMDLAFNLNPDWRVFAFAAAVAIATAIVFGIAPALRATRVRPADAMRGSTQLRGASDGSGRLTSGLIVVQIALSLVMVVAASLLIQTFDRLLRQPLGFESRPLLLADVDTSSVRIDPANRLAYYQALADAIAGVPGVARAAASRTVPLSGANQAPILAMREYVDSVVGPGYFATYGTALVSGRDFTQDDSAQAPRVAIVNQAFARKFFPDRQALGAVTNERTIVGIVEDAVFASVRGGVRATLYTPLAQSTGFGAPGSPAQTSVTISVRAASGSPLLLTRRIAAALTEADPALAFSFRPMQDYVDASVSQERAVASIGGVFGGVALLLAGLGLYGVTSYAVSRRRLEIGIRMALGAQRAHVLGLVLARSLAITSIGIAAGLAGSIASMRYVDAMLYGITPLDPLTFAAVALILAAVAIVAASIPAHRATRIDPLIALRSTM